MVDDVVVLGENGVALVGKDAEEGLGGDDAGFDDFVEAGAVFAFGKRGENGGIDENGQGLVEGADEIFAGNEVGAGFTADGSVHLGEEGGGDLDDGDAAHEDGGEEAAEVGDNAAAEGDDQAGPVGALFGHGFGELLDVGHAFVGFAAGEEQNVERAGSDGGGEALGVERPDVLRGDDEEFAVAGGQKIRKAGDGASFHHCGVGALRSGNLKLGHLLIVAFATGSFKPCRISGRRSRVRSGASGCGRER